MASLKSHHEGLMKRLANHEMAAEYLNVAIAEGDPKMFLVALRDVAEAFGGVSKLAKKTGLNRVHLYRLLSKRGNPEITSMSTVLAALGLRLTVDVVPVQRRRRSAGGHGVRASA